MSGIGLDETERRNRKGANQLRCKTQDARKSQLKETEETENKGKQIDRRDGSTQERVKHSLDEQKGEWTIITQKCMYGGGNKFKLTTEEK